MFYSANELAGLPGLPGHSSGGALDTQSDHRDAPGMEAQT